MQRFESVDAFQQYLAAHPDLTELHMTMSGINFVDLAFPADSKLKKLTIGWLGCATFLRSIVSLPAALEELQITDCYHLETLCALPPTLTKLFLARCDINALPELPSGMVSLILHDSPVKSIPHEYPDLTHVEVRRSPHLAAVLSQGIKIRGATFCFEG